MRASSSEATGRNFSPGGRVRRDMNHVMIRPLHAFGPVMLIAIAGLVVSGSAVAAATPTPASTQRVTGGSTGGVPFPLGGGQLHYEGNYSSNSQLGSGEVTFDIGNPGNPIRITRSDGMTLTGNTKFADTCGPPQQGVECVSADLSGMGDIAQANLVLAVALPPFDLNFASFLMWGTLTLRHRIGYAMVDANGSVYTFGGIDHIADANTPQAIGIELTRTGNGYWIVTTAGLVYAFGDAHTFNHPGQAPALSSGERVTSLSETPTDNGYWLFTSKGRVLPFGDAGFFGDLHTTTLNGGIVGSTATPTGKGYYMVGSDGGVFAFGDAAFHGSMGNTRLNKPVVGLVPTADNAGYWLVASDGGVFSFNAPFHGSMGAVTLNRPVVTMVPYDGAYLMVASDGGIFNFSNGLYFGSAGNTHVPEPIVNGAATG